MRRLIPLAILTGAFVLALLGLALALAVLGRRPDETIISILHGAFGSKFGLSETLVMTIPILMCAIAASIPAQGGQINIGAEGQFHLGAIACVCVVSWLGDSNSLVFALAMIGAAVIGGATWSAFPGLLRARFGVNEALITLFLNYVAIHLLRYLVHGPMRDPGSFGWPMSPALPANALLDSNRLILGLPVAIGIGVLAIMAIRFTRIGTELRAVGDNPQTAHTVGIPVRTYLFVSMVVGGAVAGLAGYYEIVAVQHRLRTDISLGFGYSGFLVSWMCGTRLWLIFPLSVLVAGLISSAENLQIASGLPAASGDVVQGLLLLFVLCGQAAVNRFERNRAVSRALKGEGG